MHPNIYRKAPAVAVWLVTFCNPSHAASAADRASMAISSIATSGSDRLPGAGDDDGDASLTQWRRAADAPSMLVETLSGTPAARAEPRLFISSGYGWRHDPFGAGARRHEGIDLPGRAGSDIYATAAGVVSFAGWAKGYGNLVQISHPGGFTTRYGHLSHILVAAGSAVSNGEVIGLMGSTGRSTGSHLHYEVRIGGVPVNPLAYLGGGRSFVPRYDVAWASLKEVTPRWTGWDQSSSDSRLPEASIR